MIAGPLFLISFAAHIYVRLRLNPKNDPELDDYYYEFEDQHPEVARYNKWSRIVLTAAAVATLLLMLAMII